MSYKSLLFILVLFVLVSTCQEQTGINKQSPAIRYLNLDFEVFTPNLKPKLWYVVGGSKGIIDQAVVYSGKASLRFECNSKEQQSVKTILRFPVDHARGKKLKYSGMIKTENVKDGYAGLWWRVDDNKIEELVLDNMEGRGPTNTTPWRQYVIEMDIPREADNIYFGVLLTGTGKAWFDDLRIALDGKPYPQINTGPIIPNKQDLKWIRANAIPLKTADPIDDHSELMPLKQLIANRRIAALGEGTHGTSEFFKMKHRITKFLAEEMGFTVFAIEANMPEAREVNRYVLTGKGDPKKALAGLYFWTWNTREVLEMIEWMREYNRSGKGKIEFYGFDLQFPQVAMQSVRKFVKKADKGFEETLDGYYKQIAETNQEFRKTWDYSKTNLEKWYEPAKKAYEHLKANREIYLKSFDAMEVDWVIQDALVVLQGAEAYMEGKRSRDETMADNLDWILNHQPPGTKVVTWAHNGHVSKNNASYRSMGSFLAERHGDNMMVFGFAFHEGEYTAVGKNGLTAYSASKSEPGSLEWYLKSSGIPNLIIDTGGALKGEPGAQWLNQDLEFRIIGAMAADRAFFLRRIPKEFDAIIFFEKATASDCFRGKKKKDKQ